MRKIVFGFIITLAISGCGSYHVKDSEVRTSYLDRLTSMQFVQGMRGAENLYLPPNSSKVYVTDLSGTLYLLEENSSGKLELTSSLKIGNYALGIAQGRDGYLYVNASPYNKEGWLERGGEVYKVDVDLSSYRKVTGSYNGINGLTMDANGDLYFAVGDLEFLFPDGAIYKMAYNPKLNEYEEPRLFLDGLGSVNGMYYSSRYDSLLFTETFSQVSILDIETKKIATLFGKTRMVEGFDDLCVDSRGRVWVAEPVAGFIKMYNPKTKQLIRFYINGLGQASSCGTRFKGTDEYILVTEREYERNNDGRGVVIFPINVLLQE